MFTSGLDRRFDFYDPRNICGVSPLLADPSSVTGQPLYRPSLESIAPDYRGYRRSAVLAWQHRIPVLEFGTMVMLDTLSRVLRH